MFSCCMCNKNTKKVDASDLREKFEDDVEDEDGFKTPESNDNKISEKLNGDTKDADEIDVGDDNENINRVDVVESKTLQSEENIPQLPDESINVEEEIQQCEIILENEQVDQIESRPLHPEDNIPELSEESINVEEEIQQCEITLENEKVESRSLRSENNIPELPEESINLEEEMQQCEIMLENEKVDEFESRSLQSEDNIPELPDESINVDEEIQQCEITFENEKIDQIESRSLQSEYNIPELPEESINVDEEIQQCDITLETQKVGPSITVCLFEAPAYIERTIKDGPDEDGDDSVFESSIHADDPVLEGGGQRDKAIIRWLSQEDDDPSEVCGGMQEPPATPIAKDEIALRRHRFFSDLIEAAKNSAEHRVRFDPLGPLIHPGCDTERENHLEELVTRLENVTNRLEILPSKLFILTQETGVQTQNSSPKISDHSSPDTVSIESVVELISRDSAESSLAPLIMSIMDYEDLLNGPVAEFLQLSQKIGGDVAAHSKLVEKSFQIQLQFLKMAASRCAPANQSEQMSLLSPTSLQIQAIQEYREKNRGSQFFNHLSAISESIPALGWVAVSPTPAPYVKEMNDAGQFYTNRVLKDWKEKNKTHVEWCKAWVQTLTELQKFVKQHHTTGLVWAKTGSAPPPPPPPGAMPPPPPCMPLGDFADMSNDDRSALFAQINQGEDITKKLKKVTSDMQTHKNSSLRTGPAPFKAPVVTNSSSSPMKTVAPANLPIDKPPVFIRDGKKWLIEYHKGNKDLLVDNPEMNNVVYMYRCQDSTLIVKGKINSIVMDSCRKSSIVFDSVVSSIEFVNCQSVQMQVLGKVPTISIDKTDGCQMYLSPESLHVELITSKSSEMNVMVPKGNGDYVEYPVPEQFKTTISPKGLNTTAVDALG